MNTGITSKEAILKVCRDIVASKGLSAVNMRSVAEECHIALGTLYNYYASKDALLLETVEDIWRDIFHMNQQCVTDFSFPAYVEHIFECVVKSAENYPGFLTEHSVRIAHSGKEKGRNTMKHCFDHIKEGMLEILQKDKNISQNAFSTSFEQTEFVDFVFDNILLCCVQGKTSCMVLIDVIKRTIYM